MLKKSSKFGIGVGDGGIFAGLLIAALLVFNGCGGGGSGEPQEQTPEEAIEAMIDAAGRLSMLSYEEGDVDGQARFDKQLDRLLEMLSSAARTQTAEQWLGYLQRTGNVTGLRAVEALTDAERRALGRAQTSAFFGALANNEEAAPFFARFFTLAYVAHVEQDNALLIMIQSPAGTQSYLGMSRTDEGRLLLMSEAETGETLRQLGRSLQAHMVEEQRKARERAEHPDAQ